MRVKCSVNDCEAMAYGHGLCSVHYLRMRDRGTLEACPVAERVKRNKSLTVNGLKECCRCSKTKPLAEFNTEHRRSNVRSWCKPCLREFNQEPEQQLKKRDYQLRTTYGITLAQYEALFNQQDRKCAICKTTRNGNRNFHVDHNHKTGTVRAILCNRCNAGIGLFDESSEKLGNAITYLHKYANN